MYDHMGGYGMFGMGYGMLTTVIVLIGIGVLIGYLIGKSK